MTLESDRFIKPNLFLCVTCLLRAGRRGWGEGAPQWNKKKWKLRFLAHAGHVHSAIISTCLSMYPTDLPVKNISDDVLNAYFIIYTKQKEALIGYNTVRLRFTIFSHSKLPMQTTRKHNHKLVIGILTWLVRLHSRHKSVTFFWVLCVCRHNRKWRSGYNLALNSLAWLIRHDNPKILILSKEGMNEKIYSWASRLWGGSRCSTS